MARTRGRPANRRNDNDNTRNIDPALLAAVNQAVENAIAQSVPQAVANALQNNRREPNNEQPENNDPPQPKPSKIMDLKLHSYSIKVILKPRFFSQNHLRSHCPRSVISLFFQTTGFGCKRRQHRDQKPHRLQT
ncbi:hypothetical protein E3N88_21735 [Mikania micrantha]|uniref:Uncharacterized protein n=1 Tax=Mikania micrantha TaxID=192012 RepID=A0A5N6N8T6_9ASTR|nr:hypothetical protein E3N88_21735 [Mikania micrantha]